MCLHLGLKMFLIVVAEGFEPSNRLRVMQVRYQAAPSDQLIIPQILSPGKIIERLTGALKLDSLTTKLPA